jgi:U3 small nucleolar RNA-associated protein 14
LFKNLFVTEEENAVMNQYEKDKNTEIEKELGTQIKVPEVKKGWNEWAGAGGLNDAKH